MEQKMRQAGRKISILMGVTMSLCLSLIGMFAAGKFTPIGWLISFLASTVVALVIGFLVPMKKVEDAVTKGMDPRSGKARVISSLVSDLIYTPLITLVMILLAYFQSQKGGEGMPLQVLPMAYLKSLAICFVSGFVLIFIFTPLYKRLVLGNMKNPRP